MDSAGNFSPNYSHIMAAIVSGNISVSGWFHGLHWSGINFVAPPQIVLGNLYIITG
jgi:hypothetical protein